MAQVAQSPQRDDAGYPTQPDTRREWRNRLVGLSKRIVLSGVKVIAGAIGTVLILQRIGQKQPPLTPQTFHPRHILVIRMDLIGDLVLTLPIVRLLKTTYPEAEIDVLAIPASAKVIADDPAISQVIAYDPNLWRRPQALLRKQNWQQLGLLRQKLRERHYDLAVSAFGPWAAALTVISGARRRIGFGRESYPGFMTDNVEGAHWTPGDHLHEIDYCLKLAQAAGATVRPSDRTLSLTVSPQASQEIEELLQQEQIQMNRPIIACHVSSNNGQSKRWPIPYWARLIDRLIQNDHYNVILTGAPADQPLIAAIMKRMTASPINLAGKTSLTQLAALLKRIDLLITGDSGPMHIAAAVDTPLIAIHGPTDPAMSGPISPQATVLRSAIWCSPCYTAQGAPADCRFFTTQCMKDITPDQVWSTIQEKLQKTATYNIKNNG